MASKNKPKSQSQRVREVLEKLHADGRSLHTVTYQEILRLCRRKLKGKDAREAFNPARSLVSVLKRPLTGGWGQRGRPTNKALSAK